MMNKYRRKRLGEAVGLIKQVKNILQEVQEKEQETYDNFPDSFYNSDRGDGMQNYIDMLEKADGYLDDANSVIEQI
jgi:hypothetical protein